MGEKRADDSGSKEGISRRDFAKTSVAAGAAAVALPATVRGEVVSRITRPAAATGKAHPAGWKHGRTIPAELYLDESRYLADEKYLADNLWIYVDHVARIPNPGDFFVFEYGRSESILVVRGKGGDVNAFYNVCRHRGSRLCRHDADDKPSDPRLSVKQLGQSGSSPVFRCPYHAWTYDTEGSLIYAYGMQEDFNPADNGLLPCHMNIAAGNIFINLSRSAEPPDFEPEVARLRVLGERYSLADLQIAARDQYVIKANWKLAIENFLECYHCGPAHASLVTTHHWDEEGTREQWAERSAKVREWAPEARREAYSQEAEGSTAAGMGGGMGGSDSDSNAEDGPWPSTSGMLNPGFVTGSMDGKPVAPLLPNIKEWNHESTVVTTGWSTGYWQCYDDHVAVARFTPRDIDYTDAEIIWLVHPDAVAGRDFDPDNVKALWHVTIQEDNWITANNHNGIRSGAYGSGRYSGSEISLVSFIDWYMNEVVPAG